MDYDVYPVVGLPPSYTEYMEQIRREYRNHLMLERLRPLDHAKVKGIISATLFNLKMYRIAVDAAAKHMIKQAVPMLGEFMRSIKNNGIAYFGTAPASRIQGEQCGILTANEPVLTKKNQ